jgi:hypothetical protein
MRKLIIGLVLAAVAMGTAHAQVLDGFGHPVPTPGCYAVSDDGFVNVREWPNGPIMGPVPVETPLNVGETFYDPASSLNWSRVQTPWLAQRGLSGVVPSYLILCR